MIRRVAFLLALLLILATELRAQILPGGGGGGSSGSSTTSATVTQSNASLLNATIVATSLPLPTGAATDAAVQDIEAALRETTGLFDVAVPGSGLMAGFRNPQGKLASASITNNNALLVEVFGGINVAVGSVGQGASASSTSAWPVFVTDVADKIVRPGDQSNSAIRVRVVASDVASGGTSSNFGTAFPSSGTAAGFKDATGAMASATVDNTGRQIVTFATPVTLNSSQPTLNVRTTSDSTLTATVSVSSVVPVVNVRSTSDGTLTATVTQTTAANLNARTDVSAATATLAPSRVEMAGGLGASANAVNFLACDQWASISTANAGNWKLVASHTSKNIYVCGYTIVAAGPVSFKFVTGRGPAGTFAPACNTGSRDLTGAMTIAASGGVVNAVSQRPVFQPTGPSEDLCINLSDGKAIGGHISYTQY